MFKKILSASLVLSMILSLVGANTAAALTASDIAMLQAAGIISASQAASLSGSVAAPVSTSGYMFAKDLTVGSKGADVTALQNLLGISPATGYFGGMTKAALIKFQMSKGVKPASGYFGPKTRAMLSGSSVTTTSGTPSGTTSGSSLAVSLAATSPVSGSVIQGQAAAGLANFTFTNTSATPAIVTNITMQRGGVSADTALANVYLFNGAVRLTDSATVSSGKVTFNAGAGLFTVAPGASVTVSVKSDIDTSAAAGQTINLSLTGVTANVPVAGVYPITGSTQTVATASDLATVTLASTSVSTSVDAGTLNQTVWGSSFTVSGRAVWLKSLAVKVIGSIPSDSLQNVNLFVSGIKVASATGIDSNGMLTFDLTSNPYKIDSNRNLEIRADVVNGSTRTFSVSLQNKADIQVVDSNYNIALSVGGTLPTTNVITVNGGTVATSLDTTLSSSNVVLGSTGVSLAKYTMKAYGENEKVSYLNVSSTQDLTNVTLYANGASISSSRNVASTSATLFSLGSSLIIPAGQTVALEIRGDLKNAAGTNIGTSSSVVVTLSNYANNAQGSYSSQLTTIPSASIAGPTMTVVGGSLTVGKNAAYSNTTLTSNTPNFKIGSFVLSSNSSEPVRITGLKVDLGGSLALTSLSNLYTSVNATKVNPQVSNNFGVDFTLAANASQNVDVYADIGSLSSSSAILTATLTVTANGVNSNVNASAAAVLGQQLTIGVGALSTPTLTTASPVSQLVIGGTTGAAIGTFNFKASIGSAVITDLSFNLNPTSSPAITSISVGGVSRAVTIGATTTISGLNISIPVTNAGTDVPVTVAYNTVGNNGIASNATTSLQLTQVKFTSGNVSSTTNIVVGTNQFTPVAGYPTIAIVGANQRTSSLTTGVIKLASVTVTAVGNTINLKKLPITVSVSGGPTMGTASTTAQIGNIVYGSATTTGVGALTLDFGTLGYAITGGTSQTFDIYGTVGGSLTANGALVTTQLGTAASVKWDDVEGNATGLNMSSVPSYSSTDAYSVANY